MGNRFFPNFDTYIVTSPFGMRTLKGVTRMHNGIDLVASKDGKVGRTDTILAHTGGTVSAVGCSLSAGNYVKIQVDPDTKMVYYHLKEKCALKKGAQVQRGDKLGYMGATGNVTGAHLHFGIKHRGAWLDPAPYLDADWAAPGVAVKVPVLKKGAKGEPVKAVQKLLGGCAVDGSFGPETLGAVLIFQEKHGLQADGSVGPATWNKLLGNT